MILKFVIISTSGGCGSMNWICFKGSILDGLYLYLLYSQKICCASLSMFLITLFG